MDTTGAVVEDNCEKSINENEESLKSDKLESEKKREETTIESRKDNLPSIDDEDVELSEAEASKDFGAVIDEDELLKDTEVDESCNFVSESSDSINPPESDKSKCIVDSTEYNIEQSGECKNISTQENSNTRDAIPDSSNENDFSLELSEEDEGKDSTNKKDEEKSRDSMELVNMKCVEEETSEAEMVVTSSNIKAVKEHSLSTSDEIESHSLDSTKKSDESPTKVMEHESASIDDESNDKSNTGDNNKSDSFNGTKFLHVDQENSRPEDSFEETGEDPFAQTSDVAMDTSESNENDGKLDKEDIPVEISETNDKEENQSDVTKEVLENTVSEASDKEEAQSEVTKEIVENTESNSGDKEENKSEVTKEVVENTESKAGDKEEAQSEVTKEVVENTECKAGDKEENQSDVTKEVIENTEKEKDLNNEKSKPNNDAMDVDGIVSDSTEKSETVCEKTADSSENKNAVDESNTSVGTVSTELKITQLTDSVNQNNERDSNEVDKDVVIVEHNDITKKVTDNIVQTGHRQQEVCEIVQPQSSKATKPPGSRKRKISEEDSDSDIDFEELKSVVPTPKRTPRRNAAKRAESQIKVLSQLDKEIKDRINEDSGVQVKHFNKPDRPSTASAGTQSSQVTGDGHRPCLNCKKVVERPITIPSFGNKKKYFCDNDCVVAFRDGLLKAGEGVEIIPPSTVMSQLKSADIQPMDRTGFVRKCAKCTSVVSGEDERTLSWETMDFCSEECLGKYQQELGSYCANCKGNVQQTSLGKYCVRFGYEVKQFCCSTCLEEFKKGLKVCSFCQKDISSGAEGFLAPVGDKGTFKDFCTPACMEKYEQMSSNHSPPPQVHKCAVCNVDKLVEIEVFFDSKANKLCSDICFSAYKFANNLTVDRCDMCKKYFDKDAVGEKFNIFYEGVAHNFCCKTCMNVYILAKRKIVPCNWCKVKKYNFDMIKRVQNNGQILMMCSLNCLTLYQVSVNAVSSKRIKCDMCNSVAQAQYHLTMSDATIRNFCTYPCVMNFQQQYSKSPITLPGNDGPPIPTGAPKRVMQKSEAGVTSPVISAVTSLANGQPISSTSSKPTGKLNLVARLCEPTVMRNKFTQTQPGTCTKSVSCRPLSNSVEVQTDDYLGKAVIPIPVPIFIPCPMAMYSMPFPVPVPFPLPIPVPVFLPTTRNSIKGIMQEIKRIQEKVPEDPFEAELLMMAEMVAEDKVQDKTSSESEAEMDNEPAPSPPNSDVEGGGEEDVDEKEGGSSGGDIGGGEAEQKEFTSEAEVAENSNAFGEDIMQMALKMATELTTPVSGEDLETQLPSSNIQTEGNSSDTPKRETKGRKRAFFYTKPSSKQNNSSEPKKKKSQHNFETPSQPSPSAGEPKPDANMKLKFTFGVNAWKSWVTQKNAEIEKLNATASKKMKPFKTDMLQLTVDELNFSLCLFIKEVKKPNGTPYAPDTIYYLCLGIQQYLFESGRIDNIFTDSYFETFTDTLDEVAKKFSELFNDHHYIVTRVEEEHLWESKQLGAHSPHVLLSTLMFFNTKHFNLTSVDEHLLLSFSHIMKHWKKNQNQSGSYGGRAPGSRNVLLRFYPPQALVDDPKLKKKKVYEQQENEENPLRCPVKLYEFYMSKCPESVKNRNDVFYLQPERSCVPDSPVWYSTMALQREPLEKMLNRVKMVKEINIALLVP